MISADLAQDLALAGLRWSPAPGDRFAIAADGLSEVFTVSEMTVEVHDYPTGRVLGFNGTTEWALDSVTIDQALWFPSEEQLRTLLGGTFRSLVRTDADGEGRFTVTVDSGGGVEEFSAADAAEAYGLAVHTLVLAATDGVVEGQPT
ncbi:pilus assembly protein CpaE [Sanguibacter suaedae]|uniref:Pilus assembly protein CpaE n=1 Tax=Sanguibacter suaedae TaxID=2795737 RepID=A0A934I763_9MICO|nr:pilus assembly protein CpaE [Sanguibacter suaedae]MBI9114422.1 pilus assembly protein CpaE [Sanguibacter suaedae]